MSDDLLDALLREALEERVLTADTVGAFAEALRSRAQRVLAERVRPLEEMLALLEGEKASFLVHQDAQNAAIEGLKDEIGRIKNEIDGVRAQHRSSSDAHDRLLAHHRAVLAGVIAALEPLTAELPWGYRRVRARIAELAASLRREIE